MRANPATAISPITGHNLSREHQRIQHIDTPEVSSLAWRKPLRGPPRKSRNQMALEASKFMWLNQRGAALSLKAVLGMTVKDLERLAAVECESRDQAAAISSGSFKTSGMLVIPCSMKTLSAIANGLSLDLVSRVADVCLQERRRLVLVTREAPLNLIQVRNMERVTLTGGVILPPVPVFYHRPKSIDDLLKQTAGKVLDQFDIEHDLFRRWNGLNNGS